MRKIRNFSLIELLVVIGIIALLAGLAMPALSGMSHRARVARAQSDISAIKTALHALKSNYGKMVPDAYKNGDKVKDIEDFLKELWSPADGTPKINKRRIALLEMPKDKKFRDPWDEEYVVYFDDDYDGKVTVNGETLSGEVFIYSKGPDKQDFTADDVRSW